MPKKENSIDGFILRRRHPQSIGHSSRQLGADDLKVPARFLNPHSNSYQGKAQQARPVAGGIQRDIDASLQEIDANKPKPKRKLFKKPRAVTTKRIVTTLGIILLLIVGYLGIRALIAGSNIFGGNIFDLFGNGTPLKTDQYGRSNILLFGTSEDDPGHEGSSLTDSVLVISVDQKKNNAFMFSVPRDLYVNYDRACPAGYEGKINALYSCASGGSKSKAAERQGQLALRKKVGEVYGMDVQYAVHVNYTVLRESVDAIGGIDVTINSRDPRGVLDRNFDWRCNYRCHLVKYTNGKHHLNGTHALFLAQARGDTAPTYGFEESNFDRERNQRKIIIAMVKKAKSAGVLANPVTINKLIDTLGHNLRTNFSAGEVKTLIRLTGKINAGKVPSIDFYKEDNQLFTTGDIGGASVVTPSAGLYEYGDIHALVHVYQLGTKAAIERASIVVLNGSSVEGAAQTKADVLKNNGLNVVNVGNAPGNYATTKIYQASHSKKPATKRALQKLLGAKATKGFPGSIVSSADFVVVIGNRS